jgi:hypothetical protein
MRPGPRRGGIRALAPRRGGSGAKPNVNECSSSPAKAQPSLLAGREQPETTVYEASFVRSTRGIGVEETAVLRDVPYAVESGEQDLDVSAAYADAYATGKVRPVGASGGVGMDQVVQGINKTNQLLQNMQGGPITAPVPGGGRPTRQN